MKRILILLALPLIVGSRPIHAESYLCVVSDATGFKFEAQTKQWRTAHFETKDKYLIRDAKEGEADSSTDLVVTKVGETKPSMFCGHTVKELNRVTCEGFTLEMPRNQLSASSHFSFDRQTLRFLYAFLGGYIGNDLGAMGTTPYLARGECSPL